MILKDGYTYELKVRNSKQDYNKKVPMDDVFIGTFQTLSKADGRDGFWCKSMTSNETLGYMLEHDCMVLGEYWGE